MCWESVSVNKDWVDFMALGNACHLIQFIKICLLNFVGQNDISSCFSQWCWHRFQRVAAAGFLAPPPTVLQYVLFRNFQFSYKQSTLSITCFCTFWNGALRQINESKYGRVPIKLSSTNYLQWSTHQDSTFYLFIYCWFWNPFLSLQQLS